MFKSWKEHGWYRVPCTRLRIEKLVAMVNGKGKNVLEAGCNEGFLSMALIEDGCKVTSLDYDINWVKRAKEVFGIEAIHADINALPFEDESFDIAVGGEVLEHLDNPIIGFKELFRVAKEKIVISLPVGAYWLGQKTHKWKIEGCSVDHDTAQLHLLKKDLIILEFTKREYCGLKED